MGPSSSAFTASHPSSTTQTQGSRRGCEHPGVQELEMGEGVAQARP